MSKPPLARKVLMVDREDGSGGYNLMIETHDGRTRTRQLTRAQADRWITGALKLTEEVTRTLD